VAVVYMLMLFMSLIDLTVTNVAAPAIGRTFAIPPGGLGAVSVAYTVALVTVIPTAAWASDRFGSKRVVLVAVTVFTVASAVCGGAWDYPALVVGRVAQGLGAGLFVPIGMAMLYRFYPPAERLRITSVTAMVSGGVPILGPVLGGFLITASWRWVFLLNVPIGLFALAYGLLRLRPEPSPSLVAPLDLMSLLLVVPGLGAVMFALSVGADDRWSLGVLPPLLGVGLVMLVLFVVRDNRAAHPLLRLRLLREPTLGRATLVTLLANASFFGFMFLGALYVQESLGLSSAASGLLFLAGGVPTLPGVQLTVRVLVPRFGPKRVILIGLIGMSVALGVFAAAASTLSILGVGVLFFALGASWSVVFIPLSITAFSEIDHDDTGHASMLYNAVRQLATALGVAAVSTALAVATPGVVAYPAAFGLVCLVSIASVVAALRLRIASRGEPART
jgi:EmrB/QacA subfamily drug resistance transporter